MKYQYKKVKSLQEEFNKYLKTKKYKKWEEQHRIKRNFSKY